MSTKNNQPQETGKTFFHFEDTGETIKVSMEGKGGDLVDLVANVIASNPDIRKIFEMAMMAVNLKEGKDVDPMAFLMAMMAGDRDDK